MRALNDNRKRSLPIALLVISVALAGCAAPDAPAATPAAERTSAASTGNVEMKDMQYSPATLTVAEGATVTWTNQEATGHTVTPTDKTHWGSEGSGDEFEAWLQNGQSWSFTFTKPGTYEYYCVPHASKGADGQFQGMVGTIIVGG